MLLAMDLEGLLQDHGCEVLAAVPDVAKALALLETHKPDAVTLDMNLDGESSAPLAAILQERNIPFLVITGYSRDRLDDPAFEGAPMLKKPYSNDDLLRELQELLS